MTPPRPVAPVPSLDQLAADPAQVRELPLEAAETLLAQVHVIEGALLARLLAAKATEAPANGPGSAQAPAEDRLLTPEEAAERLGVTPRWLYRHARTLPFIRRLSRKCLRISEASLKKWQAAKRA